MTRRNVKLFKPDIVDAEQVKTWLQAAAYAPNHRMTEPWEVLWIGPETRAKLNHKADFGGAPIVLAILSAPGRNDLETTENLIAVSCFTQNFCLMAHAAGVGTRWTSIGATPEAREVLGVQPGYTVVTILGVGYPAELPVAKERQDIAHKLTTLP